MNRRGAALVFVTLALILVFVLIRLGYVFNLEMTTDELEHDILSTRSFQGVQCSHSGSLGIGDYDYFCRQYDADGHLMVERGFEVNGSRITAREGP